MPASRRNSLRELQARDPIAGLVATAVQHHMISQPNNPPLMQSPDNVEQVVCYAVAPKYLCVKVYTTDEGVRSFDLKLTERRP